MDALRNSVKVEPSKKAKRSKKRIEGPREMLLPISGKKAAKEQAKGSGGSTMSAFGPKLT